MAAGSVMLTLPQMVDLALCAPENGIVNFNLLHASLQVLLQQLELGSCNVEFKGEGGDKIQNLMELTKKSPPVHLTEYVVAPAKDAGKVVRRKTTPRTGDAEGIDIDKLEGEGLQTVVVVEPSTDAPSYVPVVISKGYLHNLQNEVDGLKQSIKELTELPANATLIEALRSKDKATPVLDMFQMTNLSKRVDAAEVGMQKLASMMEDLGRRSLPNTVDFLLPDAPESSTAGDEATTEAGGVSGGVSGGRVSVADKRKSSVRPTIVEGGGVDVPRRKSSAYPTIEAKLPPDVFDAINNMEQRIASIENCLAAEVNFDPASGVTPFYEPMDDVGVVSPAGGTGPTDETSGTITESTPQAGGGGRKSEAAGKPGRMSMAVAPKIDVNVDLAKLPPDDFNKSVEDEIRKIKQHLKLLYDKLAQQQRRSRKSSAGEFATSSEAYSDMPPEERLTELEDRFGEYTQQISALDATFNAELTGLHDQFTNLEKEMGMVLERVNLGLPAGDSNVGAESMNEIYDKIMALQSDIDTLGDTATKLVEDMEEKQRWMDALLEQIEMLKTIKADKEDLEDALADKADACAINRKVSHDQFDTACDELSKGIEEALAKLTQQENMWQQALDEIQKEIDNKLDRMELGPLKDFVNNKLKMLQQRLKALTALKQEAEAAGTKKFLRDVNCISCDKDVVMRKEMDPSLLPQAYSLPPSKSMGPYLAYELDALRKQQKSLSTSRNLHHFESAVHSKSPRGEDHVCNRYCGGSHTVTTPQQRVTRLGHFLNQWGLESPEPLESGRKEDVVVTGEAMSTRPSKAMTSREQIEKEGANGAKRASSAQTQPKRMSSEKRPSRASHQKIPSPKESGEQMDKKPPAGSKASVEALEKKPSGGSKASVEAMEKRVSLKTSVEAMEKKPSIAGQTSPKGSKEAMEKRRSSAPPATQRSSQTTAKRSSQTSNKSAEAVSASGEKASSRLAFNIPEETPSEVAEATSEKPPAEEAAPPEEAPAENPPPEVVALGPEG